MALRPWLRRWRRSQRRHSLPRVRRFAFMEFLEERLVLSSAQPSFLLLDPSARSALEVSGNGVVNAGNGTGVVDSMNASAVTITGNGTLSVGDLNVAGQPGLVTTGKGHFQGILHAGAAAQADLLASLPAPSQPSPIFSGNPSATLSPGTYDNGIHISGNATVTLQPGIYYLKGGFDVSGKARVTGNGVTIYIADPQHNGAGFTISGQAVVNLSPADSGIYRGVTIFETRSTPEKFSVSGNAILNLIGTIYASQSALEVTGNGAINGGGDAVRHLGSQFIGYDMKVSGNGKVALDAKYFDSVTLTATLSPSPIQLADGTLVTNVRNSTISGITSPQAPVALEASGDGGFDEGTTTADASGEYTLPVVLNDGPNTLQIRATANSQQAFQTIQVTLDTVAPTIAVSSPAAGTVTNHNLTIVGQATDDRSGIATLQAALDGGAFAPVSFGAGGSFNFATALPLDHTADGTHTEHLKATDNAGNVSFFDVAFTLDTVTPTVAVTRPPAATVTNDNPTIAGQATDDRSGIASLQAALDGGAFAPVSLGAGGSFHFATALPLDHTADGTHTERLKATDKAGNVSFFDVTFTLDTVSPTIVVTTPITAPFTNHNVMITGQVSDDRSGVASLQAALDGGTFAPVSLGADGSFGFATSLPLDHTADGPHTEHLLATDMAGNTALFDVPFTLDTIMPVVDFDLDPSSDTPPVGDRHTQTAVVTLTGHTEPNRHVALQESGASTMSDMSGAFSFGGVTLAPGDNIFTVVAMDEAGNMGTAQVTITRDSPFTTLVEDSCFATSLEQTLVVPAQPSMLEFRFVNLNFDTRADFIKDAFEASLTDDAGNPLVLPISSSRDAFLNIAENQFPALSPNVQLHGDTVHVDLSHIPAGTSAVLHVRLVNNDSDTTTSVQVGDAHVLAGTMNTPVAVTPVVAGVAAAQGIDSAALVDVSSSMTATYSQTSLNEQTDVLYLGMTLQNSGSYPVNGPLLAVVEHLSDPEIRVRDSDGLTPDGLPYFRFSPTSLVPGQSTERRNLAFFNPNGIQFSYDLVILGRLNQAPLFTSHANKEAIPGLDYVYQAKASDADGDALTFRLLTGPEGMTVDSNSGDVRWRPQPSDVGNQAVLLQVDDGHGDVARQSFTIATTAPPPNRPPVFTSKPTVGGSVNTAHTYQATALDRDGDALTFSVVSGPPGLSIDSQTGLVSWTPGVNQSGESPVSLGVNDGHGGLATQTYTVVVQTDPANHSPVILSQPETTAPFSAQDYQYQVRAIDPDGDPLTYALTTEPAGMTIDATSGLIHWNVTVAGQALQFFGGNSLITPNLTSSFPSSSITLELWFKANGPGVVVKELDTAPPNFPFQHDSLVEVVGNRVLVGVKGLAAVTLGSIDFGAWHHVALRYNDSSHTLDGFLDGVKSATATTGSRTIPFPQFYQLGAGETNNLGSGAPFNGEADELRVWNVARSDSQITGNLSQPLAGNESGLVAYYRLDEGAGAIAHDNSGHGKDANLLSDNGAAPPAWVVSAPLFQPVDNSVVVRVDDGRGGVATQNYTLHFVQDAPGVIEGTVFNDLNANGSRDVLNFPPPTTPFNLLIVPGAADPYLAGMPSGATADPGDTTANAAPFEVPGLSLVGGSSLMFSVPAGIVQLTPPLSDQIRPDGVNFGNQRGFVSHLAGAMNGISGITAPPGSVVGVFLGENQPDLSPAPSALNFQSGVPGGVDYTSLSPQLKQVFFIGDGRTSSGQIQQVVVPTGATRLFLAVMDEAVWRDNGSFQNSFGFYGVDVRPFDASPSAPKYLKLVTAANQFAGMSGVTFTESLNQLVVSVNSPFGQPRNFETVRADGTRVPFTAAAGIFGQNSLASARSGNLGGFKPGDVFFGGAPGQIGRITDGGNTLINSWVTLPGELGNYEQGLSFDETGIFGGDLLVATVMGGVWRIDANGHATKLAQTPYRLNGLTVIPNNADRYGPLAGKLVAVVRCCSYGLITVDTSGTVTFFDRDNFDLEGIHVVVPNENFFSADTFSGRLYGASPDSLAPMVGEILLIGGPSGAIRRLFWDGTSVRTQLLDLDPGSSHLLPTSVGSNFTGTAGVGVVPPLSQELGTPGWIVYLDQNQNGIREADERFTTSDASGKYSFSNLTPDAYTVAVEGQTGFRVTRPPGGTYTVTVDAGRDVSGRDFGTAADNAGQRGPKIISTPPTRTTIGQLVDYEPKVSNPDGRPLTFDLPLRPVGMTVVADTGEVVWTANIAEFGPQHVILRVRDDRGNVDLQNFTLDVKLIDAAPVITSTPPTLAVVSLPYQYQIRAQDAENDPLTYQLVAFPAGMSINASTGLVTYTPSAAQLGLQAVTIHVSDGQGGIATQSYSVNVVASAANHPPTITSAPRTATGIGREYLYQVAATDLDPDPLVFTLPTAPAGMTIDADGLVRWRPAANQLGSNAVSIRVDDGRGGVVTQDYTIVVSDQVANKAPQIVSTPVTAARVGQLYAYDAVANDPDGDPIVWDLVTAPEGMSVNPNLGTLRWTPVDNQFFAEQRVLLRATDSFGGSITQSFRIALGLGNSPPVLQSLPVTQAAVNQPYTYQVAAIDVNGDPLTFQLTSAPAGMTISPISVPLDSEIESAFGQPEVGATILPSFALIQWTPTAQQIAPTSATVEVSDGHGGFVAQSWTVNVAPTPLNQTPQITPTAPLVATVDTPFAYQVIATDPEQAPLHYALQAEPSGMTIDAATGLIHWTPTAGQLGQQRVFVGATDPVGGSAALILTINVLATNDPPTITSSPLAAATVGAPYRYDVHAADIDGDILTYSLTTAPHDMTIDPLGRITWTPASAYLGDAAVQVTVSDGRGGSFSQPFTVHVTADTQAPRVNIQLSSNPADIGTSVTVIVTATDNVGVTSLTLTNSGVAIPLDPAGQATLDTSTAGGFGLLATARDAAGKTGSASQMLIVRDPHVVGAPIVDLTSPDDTATITAPTPVIGTVEDPNLVSYTLSVAPFGSDTFTDVFTGTTQITNGTLGTFDPTQLQNDTYTLRLTAINTGGLRSTVETTVNVAQNLKLGNFTLSFTDLSVPVSGIPITLMRTYDTLTANQKQDLGFGWRLEYRDGQLRTSVVKTGAEADGFFNPFKNGSRVYVTPPGGERQGFTFKPEVAEGFRGTFIGIFEPRFEPDPGVKSSLTVKPADLRIDADGIVRDFETGLPYNPADPNFGGSYLLTTNEGDAYDIDGFTGQLTEISDSNNNTLTFTDAGIVSSTGMRVTFERDVRGRIAAVIDPMGNRIRYQYDTRDDLVAVTDRTGNRTEFDYRTTPAHYLDKITDPLGRTGVRTEYDAQGRLIKTIDATGNAAQVAYDPTHSLETISDKLGNPTTYEYDDRGNIVRQIDALGGVTLRTYDVDNNMLSSTDPLGQVTNFTYDDRGDILTRTDALGNTTISTYQAFTYFTTALAAAFGAAAAPFTRLSTSTDPLGNTTGYGKNFLGAYVSTTDPLGYTVSIPFDVNGKPVSVSDGDGNTTQFLYDGDGRPVLVVDPLGNATAFTYDANGNQRTSTSTLTAADGTLRTVTTANDYDAEGRLLATTNAEGGVTRSQYDAAGNKTATIDPLGQRTTYIYDDKNELIETIYPDDTPSDDADNPRTRTEYDAAGRQTATIDALGRRTQYQYDPLGRLIKTIYPDGTFTQTEFDAAGQVIARIDQRGSRSEFTFDAVGHNIASRDPLGNVTTTTYDAAGRATAQSDPLQHATRFVFDANGHVIETDYADGTKTQTTYDSRGLPIARTDQLGQATHYQYDGNQRVILITDALGNETAYTYDEVGHQLTSTRTQTAADGTVRTLTTRMDYDSLGRLVVVTDPEGGVTRTEYDLASNRTATIDPLGQRTEYRYNQQYELVETIYADATPGDLANNPRTRFEYDDAGQKTASIDELGRRTEYQYDLLGRLVKTNYPDGAFTQTEYNTAGETTARIDERGNRIEYEYDAGGRRTLIRDALGDITSFAYDAAGRRISQTDALGHMTQFVYDSLGRRIQTQYADGTTTASDYDARGQMVAATDQLGRTTLYEHDALGRVTAVVDPLSQRTENTYDEASELINRKDANGQIITFEYDGLGRPTAITLPPIAGQPPFRQVTQYDADGDVLSTTDFNGNTITFAYDARNRVVAKSYPDGTSIHFTYTAAGQLDTETDSRGTTHYEYDLRDHLLSRIDPDGTTIAYAYDADGNRTTVTTPAGTTAYTFDVLNREKTVIDPTGGVTTYTYDAAGNLTKTQRPNNTVENRTYDSLNRLLSLQDIGPGGVISSLTYTLEANGRRDAVIENTGRRVDYSYDALDRLLREQVTDAVFGDRTISYTYDAVGNRLSRNDTAPGEGLTTYTYDGQDRLITETSGAHVSQYAYDRNGNMLSRISATDKVFYSWDYDNRLVAGDTDGDGTIDERNVYDPHRNRVSQTVGGNETRFLIDTVQKYAQVALEYKPDGTINASMVWGKHLISVTKSGAQYFFHVDGLGSTRALTDSVAQVVAQYIYDAFGRVIAQSGNTANEFLFAGQQRDLTLELDYLRSRFYDSARGRFASADPLRGSPAAELGAFQFYAYADNDPVNQTDPSGKFTVRQINFVVAGLLAVANAIEVYDSTHSLWKAGKAGLTTFLAAYFIPVGIGKLGAALRLGKGFGIGVALVGVGYSIYSGIGDAQTLAGDASGLQKGAAVLRLVATGIALAPGGKFVRGLLPGPARVTGAVPAEDRPFLELASQIEGGVPIEQTTGGPNPSYNVGDGELSIMNVKGMNPIEAQKFIQAAPGKINEVYLPELSDQEYFDPKLNPENILDDELAFAVRPNNTSKTFLFFQEREGELYLVRQYNPGDPLPPFSEIIDKKGIPIGDLIGEVGIDDFFGSE